MNLSGSPWGNTARRHWGAGSGGGEGECSTEPIACAAKSGLCNCGDGKCLLSGRVPEETKVLLVPKDRQ